MKPQDVPVSFGYKMGWLAIRSSDTEAVIAALNLSQPRPAGWEEGIDTVYRDQRWLFVTPPIDGWTLVAGEWAMNKEAEELEKLVSALSRRFGEAQAFVTHRVSEYHLWVLAREGRLLRSFGFVGDSGEFLGGTGEMTPIESALRLMTEWPEEDEALADEQDDLNLPDEETVMEIAGAWSINPSDLDENTPAPGPGLLAKASQDR